MGAGVGAGSTYNGSSIVGSVSITDAEFDITAPRGAGIGWGPILIGGESSVGNVDIQNTGLIVNAIAGISPITPNGKINIRGNLSLAAVVNGSVLDSSEIELIDAVITGSVRTGKLFQANAMITTGSTVELLVFYESTAFGSGPESIHGLSLLHIGEIDLRGEEGVMTTLEMRGAVNKVVEFNHNVYQGLIVSGGAGWVRVVVNHTDYGVTLLQGFCDDQGRDVFEIPVGNEKFLPGIARCSATRPFTAAIPVYSGLRRVLHLTAFQFFLVL
jgi:hypothetical protein